jgi:beta-xylosidase
MKKSIFPLLLLFISNLISAQYVSKVWVSDLGNGRYRNPVLYADYSDPDVCRVGDDYYMVSSSFSCVPGLPILHSKDLVNWSLVGYGLKKIIPAENFITPQHGNGVWAPSIRYHKGEFFVYYSDPDVGIYMIKTTNPKLGWELPTLVMKGKGLVDPCPIWNEDGQAYLLHEYAGTRIGIKNIIALISLKSDGKETIGDDVIIFDGHENYAPLEGAKIIKRNNYYYIFSSAGAMLSNSILCLRSKNIYGPYEEKIAMWQPKNNMEGPYKGAFIDTPDGKESWYINSQSIKNFGKVVLLNPVQWDSEWPTIGGYNNNKNAGPILNYKKPNIAQYPIETPVENEAFDGDKIGLQWQWAANPSPYWSFLDKNKKQLRLYSHPINENDKNLWNVPNLLLQKLPAETFTLTTKIKFSPNEFGGERCGLVLMGKNYSFLSLEKAANGYVLSQKECINANTGGTEIENQKVVINQNEVFLKIKMKKDFKCTFSYSLDGSIYYVLGKDFTIKEGESIGAKVGFFCNRPTKSNDAGWMDVESFTFEKQ